ncbi:STAS domain-containing protein [Kitasatospora sp. NPDC059571]|uniref:STAS domain-containing protein n=1 Tax=Kitasatospora sp. NPDC059571 TaxID=3346871 RepID=UPI00368D6D31
MSGLSVEVRTIPSGLLITAVGPMDYGGSGPLERALREALARRPAPARITVDMAGVDFCDSMGLNGLLLAQRDAGRRGIGFALARPSAAVVRLLDLTGAAEVFTILPDAPP